MDEHTPPRATTTEPDRGILLVAVSGSLDVASHRHVAAELDTAFDAGPRAVVLDLREVDFLGSAGIALLVNAHHLAGRLEVPFAIVADSRRVLRPLQVCQVGGVLPLHPTVDRAVAALRLVSA